MPWVWNASRQRLEMLFHRPPDAVLLETLRTSPHVLLYMLILLTTANWLLAGILNPWFLGMWSAFLLIFSLAHWLLVYVFRRLRAEQVEKHKKWWVLLSWHAPTVFSLLSIAIPVAISTHGDSQTLTVFTFPVAFLVIWGLNGWAASSPFVLFIGAGISGITWLLHDGAGGILAALIIWSALPAYPSASRRKVQLIARHLELLEQAAQLDRKLLERNRQLQDGNQAKSYLLGTASHGLRQPVHALVLLLESLQMAGNASAVKDKLPVLRSCIEQLSDMLRSLMDISQLDSGKYALHRQPTDAHALLTEVVSRHEPAAVRKGLLFARDMEAARGLLLDTDPDLFAHMVSNLLSNAVKFTHTGTITLQAQLDETGALRVSIRDTGIGIARERFSDIFRAYVRTTAGSTDMFGLGIGLSTVEKGARLLGMGLDFQSEPGQGSLFSLQIPASQLQAKPAQAIAPNSSDSTANASSALSINILIAEDDEVICAAMAELLKSWGHTVVTASSLDQALQNIRQQKFEPHMVLSDFQLAAGDNGLDFIARIRQETQCPQLPAILVTGDVGLTLDETLPAIRLLYKPLRPKRLRDAIETLHQQVLSLVSTP